LVICHNFHNCKDFLSFLHRYRFQQRRQPGRLSNIRFIQYIGKQSVCRGFQYIGDPDKILERWIICPRSILEMDVLLRDTFSASVSWLMPAFSRHFWILLPMLRRMIALLAVI